MKKGLEMMLMFRKLMVRMCPCEELMKKQYEAFEGSGAEGMQIEQEYAEAGG